MWLYTFKSLFITVTKQSGHQKCDYKGGLLHIVILNVIFIQNNHFCFLHFTSLQPHLHDFADQHFAGNPQIFNSFVLKVKRRGLDWQALSIWTWLQTPPTKPKSQVTFHE
jgi:hypothetical protein